MTPNSSSHRTCYGLRTPVNSTVGRTGGRALRWWVLPLRTAKRLELQDRLVPVPDGVETGPEVYHGKLGEKPDGKPREKPTAINQVGSGGLSWGLLLVGRLVDVHATRAPQLCRRWSPQAENAAAVAKNPGLRPS